MLRHAIHIQIDGRYLIRIVLALTRSSLCHNTPFGDQSHLLTSKLDKIPLRGPVAPALNSVFHSRHQIVSLTKMPKFSGLRGALPAEACKFKLQLKPTLASVYDEQGHVYNIGFQIFPVKTFS